jgi:hypothetical protein
MKVQLSMHEYISITELITTTAIINIGRVIAASTR